MLANTIIRGISTEESIYANNNHEANHYAGYLDMITGKNAQELKEALVNFGRWVSKENSTAKFILTALLEETILSEEPFYRFLSERMLWEQRLNQFRNTSGNVVVVFETPKFLFFMEYAENEQIVIYAYCADRFRTHLEKARNGIPIYEMEQGRRKMLPSLVLKDGATLSYLTAWKERVSHVARYIDDHHLEWGNSVYHVDELCERMSANEATLIIEPEMYVGT